jgi:hypothetical protein
VAVQLPLRSFSSLSRAIGPVDAGTIELRSPPAQTPLVTGTLVVSIRDARGRFCSGFCSLDGAEPRHGARITLRDVPEGPHRVVVWAEGHEALLEPVAVVAGGATRVVARLRRLN